MLHPFEASEGTVRQATTDLGALLDYSRLRECNTALEQKAHPWCLNEPFLQERLEELDALGPLPEECYWTSLARLTELALLCAGHYADNNELEAAGDLLANPPRIVVHLPQQEEPVLKQRHAPLTDQFADRAETRTGVMQWLQAQAVLEVDQPPLLSLLSGRLQDSGMFRENYLRSVVRRMQRIAEVIGLLACWHIPDHLTLHEYLRRADPQDRDFVESQLCRFDTAIFERLGQELELHLQGRLFPSEFLADGSPY